MAELADFELDETKLKNVAGGICWTDCPNQQCPQWCQMKQTHTP